jgi:hypothetical protein
MEYSFAYFLHFSIDKKVINIKTIFNNILTAVAKLGTSVFSAAKRYNTSKAIAKKPK